MGANNVELVRWFLAKHSVADVNRFPCSLPLHIACLKGYSIQSPSEFSQIKVSNCSHEECVEILLKHGAKIDVEARMCWPGPHTSNCEERGKYCELCLLLKVYFYFNCYVKVRQFNRKIVALKESLGIIGP